MTFLNRVILTGTVVTPPRRHYRPDGSPVIQFPLELNDSEEVPGSALNRTGSKQGRRNRIDVVAVGKLAEVELDLLQSGRRVMVIGSLNQRRWQTPEGRNRTQTEVIATSLQTIEENDGTQPSSLRLGVDDCAELNPGIGKPNLQRQGLRASNESKKTRRIE
ncbi:MAG TPA: single-stranded DNA-binding protein [Thermodesulfobacteriota bacterium]|nr:single-stranded DNA-binding protein [Thermodesulfobacteriota bacterium]